MAAVRDPWPRDAGICEGSLGLCRRPAHDLGRECGAQIDPGSRQDRVAQNPVKFLNDRSGDLTAGTSLPYCSERKTLTAGAMPARTIAMAEFDIQIKGGTIVDGTRVPAFRGDVWIRDGKVVQIGGRAAASAKQVIDADGLIVVPGFVDLHTHYDAQIRWDPWCTISGWHGVTSVVLGNCGFGFAPVKPDFRDRSMLTMTRTEAIPYDSMVQGMLPHWDWETIPEYLDSLDRAPKGVNVIQYMPTASLMTYVMGLEAAKTRPATEAERAEMARILDEGMDAGLCGFSIQRLGRNSAQADYDGSPMVTDTMCDEDILNLGEVLRERGDGFIQITQVTGHIKRDLAFLEKLAEVANRPILFQAVAAATRNPDIHRRSLDWLHKARGK